MKRGSFFDKIFSLVYPDSCPYCGKIIENTEVKCPNCEKNLKYIFSVREITDGVMCISPFKYEGKVRDALRNFKFRGYRRYGWNFAIEIIKALEVKFPQEKFSAVTSVPLHEIRQKSRGYNQSYELAKEIGNFLKIPNMEILEKVKNICPQYTIERYEDKIKNVKGVYKSTCQCENSQNKLLLCDDIVTGGGTLTECIKALQATGFKNILCATVANAQK